MPKRTILLILTIATLLFISGCGPTIYMAPEFESYRSSHETAAILPFDVIIAAKKLPKDYTLEMQEDAEESEGFNFQQEMYMAFLKRSEKKGYTVSFQDVDKTNAILAKSKINYFNLNEFTKEELARILGVDVLISGTIHRTRPMSTGAAVAIGVLFGVWGSTNEVNITMNIHEGQTSELLWKLDHVVSGSVGSSSERMAVSLFKKVSKKFPYTIPEEK